MYSLIIQKYCLQLSMENTLMDGQLWISYARLYEYYLLSCWLDCEINCTFHCEVAVWINVTFQLQVLNQNSCYLGKKKKLISAWLV